MQCINISLLSVFEHKRSTLFAFCNDVFNSTCIRTWHINAHYQLIWINVQSDFLSWSQMFLIKDQCQSLMVYHGINRRNLFTYWSTLNQYWALICQVLQYKISFQHLREEAERICSTNIVVCTPGRLLQHMDETAYFNADSLAILGMLNVCDETHL